MLLRTTLQALDWISQANRKPPPARTRRTLPCGCTPGTGGGQLCPVAEAMWRTLRRSPPNTEAYFTLMDRFHAHRNPNLEDAGA